ncbi:unnamed protein product [Ectocarpus sp. 12 AP-2014]
MPRAFPPLVNLFTAAWVQHSAAALRVLPRTAGFGSLPSIRSRTVSSCIGFSRSPSRNLAGSFEARLGRHPTPTAPTLAAMASLSASATGGGDDTAPDLPFRYQWPRPAVTVDCLIYALDEGKPWILLIKRKNDPFKGGWALPGGFVDQNEGLDAAARRELEEETGVTNRTMVQTGAYGDPGRDPRGHTITVAFMAWAPSKAACNARAGDDAAEARFFPVERLPSMAFDHLKVITDSWARCRFGATNDGGGVSVEDKASGQALGEYSTSSTSCAAGSVGAEALGLLVPAEASS